MWEILKQEKTPTLLVVNMMDKEHAGLRRLPVALACHDRLGHQRRSRRSCRSVRRRTFHGIVDLIENKAYTFSGKGMEEKSTEVPIPDDLKANGGRGARAAARGGARPATRR